MSEEILKALMQLFAIVAKQDEGVEKTQIEYVKNFLEQQITADKVAEYIASCNYEPVWKDWDKSLT